MTAEPLLSIIVPFHNSWHKCQRLLATLARIDDRRVEIVLVDDGSTDGTGRQLEQAAKGGAGSPRIIHQDCRGPGGARNTGLRNSTGRYVWFVDSDDDIVPEAIAEVEILEHRQYDFIDFDLEAANGRENSMDLAPGEHSADHVGGTLVPTFGRLWTKIFRREFLDRNAFAYPEYCIYEDNFLAFTLPLVTKLFYKSDLIAYRYHEDNASITRGVGIAPPFFDRMQTASAGFQYALELTPSAKEREQIERLFDLMHLANTIYISRSPRTWLLSMRVMRANRADRARFGMSVAPLSSKEWEPKLLRFLRLLYSLSTLLPNQSRYFASLRKQAWGRSEIVFPPRPRSAASLALSGANQEIGK